MELRHIYLLTNLINNEIKEKTLPEDCQNDIKITIEVNPVTFMGIDKEFYYMTHNNSYEGFVHTNNAVNATIDGIQFTIIPKQKKS